MARVGPATISPVQLHRVLALLDALARAGLVPSESRAVHELAYLANVLAPVFDLSPLDAKLLKRKSGPYYPELQQALDALVGRSLVDALNLTYAFDEVEERYRVQAVYRLRRSHVTAALQRYRELNVEEAHFLYELASAYAGLEDAAFGRAALCDARYADADVDTNNVIDFGEWTNVAKNFSRNAAMAFAPTRNLFPAERLYLYLDYLGRKVRHGT